MLFYYFVSHACLIRPDILFEQLTNDMGTLLWDPFLAVFVVDVGHTESRLIAFGPFEIAREGK